MRLEPQFPPPQLFDEYIPARSCAPFNLRPNMTGQLSPQLYAILVREGMNAMPSRGLYKPSPDRASRSLKWVLSWTANGVGISKTMQ